MIFKVTRKIEGEKIYLVDADSKDTVEALFNLYFEPADFCPDIKVIVDEAEESNIISIEEYNENPTEE